MYGFGGTTLRIDLGTGEIDRSPTSREFARKWMGARGFISKILYDEVPRDADPLGPENVFVMAPGVLTGSYAPSGSKIGFGCISPATNGLADSSMGGHLGPELKYAGYDLVIMKGIAEKPQFLLIDDDDVSLRDATAYWGKGSLELEEIMKSDLGQEFQIATVGPAAENGVVFSCITHDFGRQAGRCGTGAVLGSKRIKAIAVRGTGSLLASDIDGLTEHTSAIIQRTKTHPNMKPWQKYGTSSFVDWSNERGCFPTRNSQTTHFEDAKKINGDALVEECLVSHKACFGCWMNCGKYSRAQVPGKPVAYVEGPEYETLALIGGSCALGDINQVAYANYLCDDLGLDTISAGSVVAFAIECFEKGIITVEQLEGREIRFGSIDDFEYLLRKIATRDGIGDLLAKGSRGAAEILGLGSIDFALQVKGMECSGYDPRWYPAQLLSFCTADIGAHHNRSWSITADLELGRETIEGKAQVVIYLQHIRPLFDTWSCCRLFWGELDVTEQEHVDTINLLTGWNTTLDECLRISERIWNLNRAHFLERNGGVGRDHDVAPNRYLKEPVPSGPAQGKKMDGATFDRMLDEYYRCRGWDRSGNPTEALLADLELDDVALNLQRRGLIGQPFAEGLPPVRGKELKPRAM